MFKKIFSIITVVLNAKQDLYRRNKYDYKIIYILVKILKVPIITRYD